MWRDGTSLGTIAEVNDIPILSRSLDIGRGWNSTFGYLDGYMDRLEIRKGIAPASGNFTPPTDAITPRAYQVLVSNFDEPDASTRIVEETLALDTEQAPYVVDISGNKYDAVQATASKIPTKNQSRQAIVFDGIDDFLVGAGFAQAQTFSIYTKCNIAAAASKQVLFGTADVTVALTADEYFEADAGSAVSDSTDHSGAWKTFAVEVSGATSKLYVDGVLVASGDLGVGTLTAFVWGANSGGAENAAMTGKNVFVTPRAYESDLNTLVMAT